MPATLIATVNAPSVPLATMGDAFSMEAMYARPAKPRAKSKAHPAAVNGVRWDAKRARFRSTRTGRYVRRPHPLTALELMGYHHRPGAKGRVITDPSGKVVCDGRGGWVANVEQLAERVYREAVKRSK